MGLEFTCPHCSQLVRTAESAAGKKGRCPHCHAVVQIPALVAPPTPAAPATPTAPATPVAPAGRAPAPATAPAHRPVSTPANLPTLAPLDSVPGLVPLGPVSAAPRPATFQPVTPHPVASQSATGAYSPLGAAPAPLDGNLLAGLPPAQFSGPLLPAAHLAPATSPLGPAYSGAPLGGGSSDTVSDVGRKGLAWEREANFDNFQDTAMAILSEPHVTFRQMRRHGGLLNPLAFLMIGLLVGSIATSVYYLIFMLIVIMSTAPVAEAFAGLGIAAAAMLFGNLIGAIVASVVGSFVAAGFWHVVLLIFGSARGGFEGTYRAVCFTAGSIALLNVLPIVGPLVGIVLGIVVMIHAFIHTHEASSGRVVAAVLIPYALACCCALPGLFAVIPAAMAGLQGF